jgi:peptidoglycan hydrolase CwlO-like protein
MLLMNNEDKILTLLETLVVKVDKLEAEVTDMKTEITDIKTEITNMKTQFSGMRENVALIEVEHGQKLGALFDAYSAMSDDIKLILPTVSLAEKTASDIVAIKCAVISHAKIFGALKAAMKDAS